MKSLARPLPARPAGGRGLSSRPALFKKERDEFFVFVPRSGTLEAGFSFRIGVPMEDLVK